MRAPCLLAALLLAAAIPRHATAQPNAPPTGQSDLDLAIRRGGLATLAPLCGARDDHWAEDLRRAAMQDAAHAAAPDDPALHSAPGADLATAALGFAEAEALEDFAETSPQAACAKITADPGLPEADRRVAAYRRDLAATHRVW